MKETIYDDRHIRIGWTEQEANKIKYYSIYKGMVGWYNLENRQYTRFFQIPGKPTMTMPNSADYGMSDVLYWAEKCQ